MFIKPGGALALLLSVSGTLAHPGGLPRLQTRNGFVDIDSLMPLKDRLVKRVLSPDGTCGGANGYSCGTDVNKCCSQYGYCGDTDLHCQTSENCQPAFGTCTTGGSQNGRCGTQGAGAICANGECCSEGGYCGATADFCMAPLCQMGFGKCDADATPAGASTEGIARPALGTVPYGDDIYDCAVAGTIALTFDDGPGIYTDEILNLLDSYSAKGTFFITGINNGKGAIDSTPAWTTVIQKMHANGHQVAGHTWSHADLSTLTEAARQTEMIKLEMALRNILGFIPTYFRPPYSSCTAASGCMATANRLGYHISYFDLDTDDYNQDSPLLIQNSKNNFDKVIDPSNPATSDYLVISHDIHEQTAHNLTAYMLDKLQAKGYRAVTMGECLGDPPANWYRSAGTVPVTSSSSTSSSTSSTTSKTSITSSTTSSTTSTTSSTTSTTSTTSSKTSSTSTPTSSSTSASSTKTTSSVLSSSTSTTKTSSSISSGPTNPVCAHQVGNWCATPLATYTNIAGCWATVGNCWDQGDKCWDTVAYPKSNACTDYQAVCQKQEDHCGECVTTGTQTCRFLTPVYPPNAP